MAVDRPNSGGNSCSMEEFAPRRAEIRAKNGELLFDDSGPLE